MPLIKTSELIGPALDWAVAKCEGIEEWDIGNWGVSILNACTSNGWSPSSNWFQGGPIMEREITGVDLVSEWKGVKKWSARKFEYLPNDQTRCTEQYGPTQLIAAMRCYVASKLGDEVEVHHELMEY